MARDFDVVVVGAGVVGTAIARRLSLTRRRVLLVDAGPDIGAATSKANTAILHTGFDAKPATLESRLVARGYQLLADYATAANIAVEPLGALLVAWDEDQLRELPKLAAKAKTNGYMSTREVDAAELAGLEPNLGPGALGALAVPGESIIDPWTPSVAFATEGLNNGLTIRLRCELVAVDIGEVSRLSFGDGSTVTTKWTINAAGLHSDVVDGLFGHREFGIIPRRGQLIVFDKFARSLVDHILLPVPTAMGKGVLISPTVFGNVMLGPTAEDLDDKSATQTTSDGLQGLLDKGSRLMPRLLGEEVTATYSGLRAATEHDDYQIRVEAGQRYACVGGIRSTGLTSSLAIAEYLGELLSESGLDTSAVKDEAPPWMPPLGESHVRPYQDAALVRSDRAYGDIVCFCERTTWGEIRDAVNSPVPPADLDGLRRRTRVMNGRCQGFFCGAPVLDMFDNLVRQP